MSITIEELLVRIEANTDQMNQEFRRAAQTVEDGGRRIDRAGKLIERRIVEMGRAALASAGAFAIAYGTRGLVRHIGTQLQAADSLQKMTERIGGSVEALSELQHVFELSGVALNTGSMGLQRMTRRIAEAAQGAGEARGAIRELGLDAEFLAQLPLDEQFEAIAAAMQGVTLESDRTRLAMRLFDSEGVALLQTMTRGAEGIREMREEARALGRTLTTEQAEAAVRANDAMTRLTGSVSGLTRAFAVELAPVIETSARNLTSLTEKVGGFVDGLERAARFAQRLHSALPGGFFGLELFGASPPGDLLEDPRIAGARGYSSFLAAQAQQQRAAAAAAARRSIRGPGAGLEPISIRATERDPMRSLPEFDPSAAFATDPEFERVRAGLRTQEEIVRESYERRLAIIKANTDESSEEQMRLIERLDEQTRERLESLTEDMTDRFGGLGMSLGRGIEDALTAAFMGAETSFDEMLQRMLARAAASQLLQFLGGLGGPVGRAAGFLGFGNMPASRHGGGPVGARIPYLVRPDEEVFIPSTAGRVEPIRAMGAGNVQVNIINQAADNGVQVEARETGPGMVEVLIGTVNTEIARGRLDGAMGSRYGLRPKTGVR